MARINPHINFNGNAEDAFTFYKSVFGGEFAKIIRFKDLASPEFKVAKKEEMKNSLLFDFTVDKAAQTVNINREFDAPLSLVWDAFTKREILDQWWAPKPYSSKTKFMNFEVGGRRFYAMVSPEGQERWAIQQYTSISPKTNFKFFNAFADQDENPEIPGSNWSFNFSEQNGSTIVSISIYNESLARMEKMIEMGFKEGYAMQMKNLDELLATLSQK